jgi:hypothetical protein
MQEERDRVSQQISHDSGRTASASSSSVTDAYASSSSSIDDSSVPLLLLLPLPCSGDAPGPETYSAAAKRGGNEMRECGRR